MRAFVSELPVVVEVGPDWSDAGLVCSQRPRPEDLDESARPAGLSGIALALRGRLHIPVVQHAGRGRQQAAASGWVSRIYAKFMTWSNLCKIYDSQIYAKFTT